jgi:hypothetical protein
MSRTNGSGAWVGGLALACALEAVRLCTDSGGLRLWKWIRAVLLAAIIGAFTWTNWIVKSQYEHSWKLQEDILTRIESKIAKLPGPMTILLADYPAYSGVAIVFDAFWDFDAALRISTGRKDLSGDVFSGRWRFEKNDAVNQLDAVTERRYPYSRLFLYRYSSDVLEELNGPPTMPLRRDDLRP